MFGSGIDAESAWTIVQKYRAANKLLNQHSGQLSGRDAQLAVHGNRFIEHIVITSSKKRPDINLLISTYDFLKKIVDEQYSDCYLAVLFKNAKKCEVIEKELRDRMNLNKKGI